jgi:hypothetical protein
VRHRNVADYGKVIRIRTRADLKGESTSSRMGLQTSRLGLSLEKRPKIHTESTQIPLIDEALPGPAETITLNGILQVLHSRDPKLSRIYDRAEDA